MNILSQHYQIFSFKFQLTNLLMASWCGSVADKTGKPLVSYLQKMIRKVDNSSS